MPPAASRSSSVAPTEFYSEIAQALRRAQAQVGDPQDYDFWNKMRQHNLVLWPDYIEEATSYHTLDMSMWGAVNYRRTFRADSRNIVQSAAIGRKQSPSLYQTSMPIYSDKGFFTEFWHDPQALELAHWLCDSFADVIAPVSFVMPSYMDEWALNATRKNQSWKEAALKVQHRMVGLLTQHIDLKTAFLQGANSAPDQDVVCQLPAEAGKPWYLAARLKKPAYGMNDAPKNWWNRLDAAVKAMGLCRPEQTDAPICPILTFQRISKHTWPMLLAQVKRRRDSIPSLDEGSYFKVCDDILDQLMEADENKQLKVWSSEVERRDFYLTAKKTSPSWKKVMMHKTVDVENDRVIKIKYIGDRLGQHEGED